MSFPVQVYSAELNRELRKTLVGVAFTGAKYRGDIEKPGSQVTIYSPASINVQDYDGSDLTVQSLTTGSQTVTVDQAKAFAYDVDDLDQLESVIDIVASHVEEARYALADKADQHIFDELITAANTAGNTIETSAATAEEMKKVLMDADVALSELNVPRANRRIALPPSHRALIAEYMVDAVQSEAAAREGFVGRAFGFDIFETNNLPTYNDGEGGTGGDDHVQAYASFPFGAVFASKLLKVQMVEPHLNFTTLVKGLYVYQAHLWKPSTALEIDITL